jgi:hypothetical protein
LTHSPYIGFAENVSLWQSVCGIGIVKNYYTHLKFNVMEIANLKNAESNKLEGAGRVTGKAFSAVDREA